jgi:hypothetical protein
MIRKAEEVVSHYHRQFWREDRSVAARYYGDLPPSSPARSGEEGAMEKQTW